MNPPIPQHAPDFQLHYYYYIFNLQWIPVNTGEHNALSPSQTFWLTQYLES